MFNNSEHFFHNVYGTLKGSLRQQQLEEDLLTVFARYPTIQTIVDIGGGHAPVARSLLHQYPEVQLLLVEPDPFLANKALEEGAHYAKRIKHLPLTLEELTIDHVPLRSLILCHGVAGWVEQPLSFLSSLAQLATRTNSALSILVGQRSGHLLPLLANNQLSQALDLITGTHRRLASSHSPRGVYQFTESEVRELLVSNGLCPISCTGIRVISDYLFEYQEMGEEEIRKVELIARSDSSLRALANMLHLIAITKDMP